MSIRAAVAGLALLGQACAAAADVSAASVLADIARLGARGEAARLNAKDGRDWETVMRRVQSGRPEWLDVARQLKAGTDAGPAEDLRASVAMALARNPAGLLALVPSDFALADICTVPMIEPTDKHVADYKRAAEKALYSVSSGPRSAVAAECREKIAEVP